MRRFVQNLLVGSGVTKVSLVLKIARRMHPTAVYGLEQEGRLAAQNTRDGAVDWAAVKT